jgi:polysaccharide deacetylase family protein (PEP-CTERM system associated)
MVANYRTFMSSAYRKSLILQFVNERMHILTFDIEDWYHFLEHRSTRSESEWKDFEPRVIENTNRILQLLDDQNQKATFFIIGWIAAKNPGLVKTIADAGHEIGLHSYGHQLIWQQSPEEFRQDLLRNIGILEDQLGYKVLKYRAPGFSVKHRNLWAFEVMAEAGITTDASIFPAARAHGGMPDFPFNEPCRIDYKGISIKEFPMNYVKWAGIRMVVTGGGYFRFWPYRAIEKFTRKMPYVMTYFHPRDFDIKQPLLSDLGPYRRFRAYYGIGGTTTKLVKWIEHHNFTDLQSAEASIDWENAPVAKF